MSRAYFEDCAGPGPLELLGQQSANIAEDGVTKLRVTKMRGAAFIVMPRPVVLLLQLRHRRSRVPSLVHALTDSHQTARSNGTRSCALRLLSCELRAMPSTAARAAADGSALLNR